MNNVLSAFLIGLLLRNCDRWHRKLCFPMCSADANYANCSNDWMQNLIPNRYRRSQAPVNIADSEPVFVVAYVTPKFVTEISMKNMDFVVDMVILVEWYDNRLQLPSEEFLGDSDNTLPGSIAEKIWYPSIFLDNCKDNGMLVTTPKDGPSGLINVGRLWTDVKEQNSVGMRVYYRKGFRFTCDLNFAAYPFDVQHCAIQLTWNYKRSKPIRIQFHTDDHDRPNLRRISVPPGFHLITFVVKVEDNDTSDVTFITERRSLTFTFSRVFGQHLMLIFLPSLLIVILSWLSFWLDVSNAAPRVALGLTSLLTLSTQFNAAQRDLPPVDKIKAMDIWMFTCMFAVFASLMEYGIAQFFRTTKVATPKPKIRPRPIYCFDDVHTNKNVKNASVICKRKSRLYRRCCSVFRPSATASRVDYISRIVFPLAFLIFNIWFWSEFYPSE